MMGCMKIIKFNELTIILFMFVQPGISQTFSKCSGKKIQSRLETTNYV